MTIAKTIADQLGNMALRMMGAKNLLAGSDYLQFKIGRNAKGVNLIRIILTPADLYKVEFIKVRKLQCKTVAEHDGVYADMLHGIIEDETGMYLSMGNIYHSGS